MGTTNRYVPEVLLRYDCLRLLGTAHHPRILEIRNLPSTLPFTILHPKEVSGAQVAVDVASFVHHFETCSCMRSDEVLKFHATGNCSDLHNSES